VRRRAAQILLCQFCRQTNTHTSIRPSCPPLRAGRCSGRGGRGQLDYPPVAASRGNTSQALGHGDRCGRRPDEGSERGLPEPRSSAGTNGGRQVLKARRTADRGCEVRARKTQAEAPQRCKPHLAEPGTGVLAGEGGGVMTPRGSSSSLVEMMMALGAEATKAGRTPTKCCAETPRGLNERCVVAGSARGAGGEGKAAAAPLQACVATMALLRRAWSHHGQHLSRLGNARGRVWTLCRPHQLNSKPRSVARAASGVTGTTWTAAPPRAGRHRASPRRWAWTTG